jgi:hypothetical protein
MKAAHFAAGQRGFQKMLVPNEKDSRTQMFEDVPGMFEHFSNFKKKEEAKVHFISQANTTKNTQTPQIAVESLAGVAKPMAFYRYERINLNTITDRDVVSSIHRIPAQEQSGKYNLSHNHVQFFLMVLLSFV